MRGEGHEMDFTVTCKEPTCESNQKFESIIKYLEHMEDDISEQCDNIKTYIHNVEEGFNAKLEKLRGVLEENEKLSIEDNKQTQVKLNSMNEKIFEIRQILGKSAGGQKVGKLHISGFHLKSSSMTQQNSVSKDLGLCTISLII